MKPRPKKPSWDRLYDLAASQGGHFTTAQGAAAGYYPQLLSKHLRAGRIERVRRGIYRVVHFPAGEHEDLVVLWLWSQRNGVFSHETALALHQLSDALPSRIHLTVPLAWKSRRLGIPEDVAIHHADLQKVDQGWYGEVPVTTPTRTLLDCVDAAVPPGLVEQALDEGLSRGLFVRKEVQEAVRYLERFRGGAK